MDRYTATPAVTFPKETAVLNALLTAVRPTPAVRIVAESAWGHVQVFTEADFPAARAMGWQALGVVTPGTGHAPARHARRLAAEQAA